jgi:hypothetical protein
VNKRTKQEKNAQAILSVTVGVIVILVSLCGCTSNQNTNKTETQLSGTWIGNVEMSGFGRGENTSISQLKFMSNTAELTLENAQGSFIMNYTFTVNENSLVLQPIFSDRGGFPGQPSQNGTFPWNDTTRPPMNETWPINGTRPPMNETWPTNGTRPGNWTRTENGTRNPGGRQQPMSISFSYSLNEEHTILYLNGVEFRKLQ